MRPRYESAEDLARERKVVDHLISQVEPDLTATKLDPNDPADYLLEAPGERWAVEVKCRTNHRTKYPDYMISAHKLRGLSELAGRLGATGLLAVRWTDCVGTIHVEDALRVARWDIGGRRDRGDALDMEQVGFIDIGEFRLWPGL